uniref:Protein argonaute-2 n=1 Tax=Cacopsylla melanoneura TaxID=428564 RepID=A0A8D8WZL0_9HEMI
MGNKLSACSCAPLMRKAYRYEDSPWQTSKRRDGHLLRLWAEVFHVSASGAGSVKWQQVSEDLVPVNITCIQDAPNCIFLITAYNSQVDKILDVKLVQPGTRIGQASECFVYWKDPNTNDTWGLNFTSPIDARQFRECCSPSFKFSRKASSSYSLKLDPPSKSNKIKTKRKPLSTPASPNRSREPQCTCMTPEQYARLRAQQDHRFRGSSTLPRAQNRLTESTPMSIESLRQGSKVTAATSSTSLYDNVATCNASGGQAGTKQNACTTTANASQTRDRETATPGGKGQQQQQQQQQPQKPQQQPQQQQQKPQQQAPQPAQQQAPKQQQSQPAQVQQAGPSQQQQGGGGGGGGKKKGGKGGAGGGDAGVAQVTAQVQQMSVVPTVTGSGGKGLYQIPRRQNKTGGTLGQRIQVDTNHFAISFKNPDLVIFHYDVAIDPDTPVRYMRPVIAETAKKHFPRAAFGYDGKKNLFSKGALPFGVAMTATVTIYDVERMKDKEYKVEIKKAQEINFASIVKYMNTGVDQPQIAIQALDVILREPSCVNPEFVRVGRSYFSKPDPRRLVDLGDGLHLWPGFYQSSRIGWRPFLNVDVAHKGFPVQMHVIDIIKDICRGQLPPELNDYDKVSLKTRVGNLKVIYEIPNQPNSRKIYKVNKIVGSALQERFKPEQGSAEITIADYFSRSKNYRLQFPKYPCFQVGSVANNSRIPCELCTLQGGQVVNKKMNETQTAAMVKAAATGTDIRRQKVMDAMRKINFGNCALLKDFGIGVSDQMERVNARILPPPTVGYDNNRTILVQKGVWRADKFIKPTKITSWAYVNMVHGRPPNWRSLCDNFPGGANSVGMEFPKNPSMVFEDQRENNRNLHNVFAQCKQKGVQVVFVAVPNSGDVYSKVKQVAELEVGVLTQCLREKTLFKMNPATTGNILLKLNAKLNGINHYVKDLKKPRILGKPTIIFGADVTHPSPDETSIPSVAAVTSSYDPAAFKYNMMWNLQDPRVEIIEGLQTFVETQLKFFINANKRKPEHIIFYRDGVSEGQFQQVMGAELTAIKRACQAIESNYNPPVTFLVVQKRHHTRFFPSSPAEGDGSRNNNVRPGTIVDTTITHPTDLDFYLVSHASIQGTARPTKYYRLWDEAKLTDDETEEMTYYLCHLFSRCTRSVSYPAPTYYAHLAAFRGRVYIKNRHINLDNLPRENNTVVAKPDFLQANPMYFV